LHAESAVVGLAFPVRSSVVGVSSRTWDGAGLFIESRLLAKIVIGFWGFAWSILGVRHVSSWTKMLSHFSFHFLKPHRLIVEWHSMCLILLLVWKHKVIGSSSSFNVTLREVL
jgi:hypothetical protein